MIGDSVVNLIRQGCHQLTEPVNRGKTVTGALIGTKRLYDFAHRNEDIVMETVSHTHSQKIMSCCHVSFPSILPWKWISAAKSMQKLSPGGILAHRRSGGLCTGATLSSGGRSIIALPATARGKMSRIVPRLSGPVTTARSDVDIIVPSLARLSCAERA